MILRHHTLTWEIHSPSYWRLVLPWNNGDTIDISYLGAANEWCLFVGRQDDVTTRLFASRDDAMAMVREAFNREGVA